MDWKWRLTINWTDNEKEQLTRWLTEKGIEKASKKR